MSLDFADDQSTLAQVTAWCHQATSHYLSQCWHRFLSPYGVTGHIGLTCIEPRRSHVNKVNILHAEALLMQGARVLAAMVLVFIQWVEMLLTVWISYSCSILYLLHTTFQVHYLNQYWPRSMMPHGFYRPQWCIMTSSNGNIFRVTGYLCGEFTDHRWIPLTKASDVELWCLLWFAPE